MPIVTGGLLGPAGLLTTGGLSPGSGPATVGIGTNAVSAVVAWFAGTPSIAALVADGRLHYIEAPEGTPLPFAVIVPVAGPLEELTASERFELVETVQISIRAAGAVQARQIIMAIRRALRFTLLSIDGQATRSVYVVGAASDKFDGRSLGAREVYFESADFEIAYGTEDDTP